MNIAHSAKYELIPIQKERGGPSLTQPNPTAMKESAKPIEAAPDTLKNHLAGAPLCSVCAAPKANAPTLTAISTKSKEIGRKRKGPRTSGDTPISPNAPSARPCSDRSQVLRLPEFHRPAVIAQAPARNASMLISQSAFREANPRNPTGSTIKRVQGRTRGVGGTAKLATTRSYSALGARCTSSRNLSSMSALPSSYRLAANRAVKWQILYLLLQSLLEQGFVRPPEHRARRWQSAPLPNMGGELHRSVAS
jgi:hypothetical protein